MNEMLMEWVSRIPGIAGYESMLLSGISFALILIVASISYFVVKQILVRLINRVIVKSKSDLDDVLLRRKVFNRTARLLPAWLIYKMTPAALIDYPVVSSLVTAITAIYLVLAFVLVVDALIDSLLDIYHSFPVSRQVPLQNFGQVAKLLTYFVGLIVVASLVLDQSPVKLFAGLGAMTAVLMLVFKDPILGFVAGLQLSFNKMVGVGDWVEIPQHNADGDILEIGLTTVKVRNFDNTVTTVPTQSLINESFKNWRGMQESGGRRIKRAINIDLNSIQLCDSEALARYSQIDCIKEYIADRQRVVDQHNKSNTDTGDSIVNGRRMTNIGTFRAYVMAYLKNHPDINQNLTLLVRQLAPTDVGLPLEIYAFSSEKNWHKYEAIQADIFDHLFAVAKEFDLRVFQKPAGLDLQNLGNDLS